MLKSKILKDLEENRGKPISGQTLAEKNNVSRNAVWKAINALKEDGHEIISGRNKGYYLSESSDKVSAEGIRSYLGDRLSDVEIMVYDELDSTNNEAKRKINTYGAQTKLLVAETQTEGRGRIGKSFFSPPGSGIYMSVYYRSPKGVRNPMMVTMAAAVAVVRTIEMFTDIKPGIKWVNDIFIGDKKCCAILTEAVTDLETGLSSDIIVGIGLNVRPVDFPPELSDIVTSLGITDVTRNQLIAELLTNLSELCRNERETFMEEYIAHSNVNGKHIKYEVDGKACLGTVVTVKKSGALEVKRDSGETDMVTTGEILFREKFK